MVPNKSTKRKVDSSKDSKDSGKHISSTNEDVSSDSINSNNSSIDSTSNGDKKKEIDMLGLSMDDKRLISRTSRGTLQTQLAQQQQEQPTNVHTNNLMNELQFCRKKIRLLEERFSSSSSSYFSSSLSSSSSSSPLWALKESIVITPPLPISYEEEISNEKTRYDTKKPATAACINFARKQFNIPIPTFDTSSLNENSSTITQIRQPFRILNAQERSAPLNLINTPLEVKQLDNYPTEPNPLISELPDGKVFLQGQTYHYESFINLRNTMAQTNILRWSQEKINYWREHSFSRSFVYNYDNEQFKETLENAFTSGNENLSGYQCPDIIEQTNKIGSNVDSSTDEAWTEMVSNPVNMLRLRFLIELAQSYIIVNSY